MSTSRGTQTKMGVELIHKRGDGLRGCLREGSKRELHVSINSTHIPGFYYPYVLNFYFLIECPQIQSLNACKRVGVRSDIP
jgi:hypothetical protein